MFCRDVLFNMFSDANHLKKAKIIFHFDLYFFGQRTVNTIPFSFVRYYHKFGLKLF